MRVCLRVCVFVCVCVCVCGLERGRIKCCLSPCERKHHRCLFHENACNTLLPTHEQQTHTHIHTQRKGAEQALRESIEKECYRQMKGKLTLELRVCLSNPMCACTHTFVCACLHVHFLTLFFFTLDLVFTPPPFPRLKLTAGRQTRE